MNEIAIYRCRHMWVFDQEELGLKAEAFVRGCSEILSGAIHETFPAQRKINRKEWKISFGSEPEVKEGEKLFTVRWMMEEGEGNWYYCPELDKIGWLCGRLYNFFKEAPRKMYFKVARYNGEQLNAEVIKAMREAMGIQLSVFDEEDDIARKIRDIVYVPSQVRPRIKDSVFHAIQPGTLEAVPVNKDKTEYEIVLYKADGRVITVQRKKR